MGEPLLHRAREAQARPAAAAALTSTANRLIAAATTNDAKHAHIPQDDKDKVGLYSGGEETALWLWHAQHYAEGHLQWG